MLGFPLGHAVFTRVLPSFTWFDRVFTGFYWILLGLTVTSFYLLLVYLRATATTWQ